MIHTTHRGIENKICYCFGVRLVLSPLSFPGVAGRCTTFLEPQLDYDLHYISSRLGIVVTLASQGSIRTTIYRLVHSRYPRHYDWGRYKTRTSTYIWCVVVVVVLYVEYELC
jgi:hypothetical protein